MKRPQFSLRTLLIAVTAFATLLGATAWWYRAQVAEYHREQAIAERLQQRRVYVGWRNHIPFFLKWSENMPIAEVFRRIDSISMVQHPEQDLGDAAEISTLQLLSINVDISKIHDGLNEDIIRQIGNLSSLKTLCFTIELGRGELNKADESAIKAVIDQIKQKLPHLEIIYSGIRD